jgi:hypothetical protein
MEQRAEQAVIQRNRVVCMKGADGACCRERPEGMRSRRRSHAEYLQTHQFKSNLIV